MTTFGERLKELRTFKNLTQDELAKKFYLNKSSISRYEKDQQIPEMPTLEKLALFFDVSIDYLLGKTDIKNLQETTIALHSDHDYEDLPEEARKEIDNFIEYVRNKYQK